MIIFCSSRLVVFGSWVVGKWSWMWFLHFDFEAFARRFCVWYRNYAGKSCSPTQWIWIIFYWCRFGVLLCILVSSWGCRCCCLTIAEVRHRWLIIGDTSFILWMKIRQGLGCSSLPYRCLLLWQMCSSFNHECNDWKGPWSFFWTHKTTPQSISMCPGPFRPSFAFYTSRW